VVHVVEKQHGVAVLQQTEAGRRVDIFDLVRRQEVSDRLPDRRGGRDASQLDQQRQRPGGIIDQASCQLA
jgi:hypothetical protein